MNLLNQSKISVNYQRGETIIKQGTFSSHIIYVKSGVLKEYFDHKNKDIFLNIVTPGFFVGLDNLFSNKPFNYSVASFIDSSVCMFEKSLFEQFIKENQDFSEEIYVRNSEHYKNMLQNLEIIAQLSTKERLATALLMLDEKLDDDCSLLNDINKKQLAEVAHISPDSLTSLVREFSKANLIRYEGTHLQIIDTEEIRRII
jgi:CRP-like cAMP-binding protein